MNTKDFQQLKTKPAEELKKMVGEFKDKIWTLREDLLNGKVKNVKEMRDAKKTVAQILTILNDPTHGK